MWAAVTSVSTRVSVMRPVAFGQSDAASGAAQWHWEAGGWRVGRHADACAVTVSPFFPPRPRAIDHPCKPYRQRAPGSHERSLCGSEVIPDAIRANIFPALSFVRAPCAVCLAPIFTLSSDDGAWAPSIDGHRPRLGSSLICESVRTCRRKRGGGRRSSMLMHLLLSRGFGGVRSGRRVARALLNADC
jgi:hypothetical protein